MLITVCLQPQQRERFLLQKPYNILFRYLKTIALIILNKTENHKDKIYAFILAILIKSTTFKNYKY